MKPIKMIEPKHMENFIAFGKIKIKCGSGENINTSINWKNPLRRIAIQNKSLWHHCLCVLDFPAGRQVHSLIKFQIWGTETVFLGCEPASSNQNVHEEIPVL